MSKILGIFNRLIFAGSMIYLSCIAGIWYGRDFLEEYFGYGVFGVTPLASESLVNGMLAFLTVLLVTALILSATTEERKYTRMHKHDMEL